jgi:hypothetical protein
MRLGFLVFLGEIGQLDSTLSPDSWSIYLCKVDTCHTIQYNEN